MAKLMQYLGSWIVVNTCMCLGVMFAWPSSTLRLFGSTNTPLHRPMNDTELALLGSISSVGALVATPVAGIYLNRYGRKKCTIISCLLAVLAWAMLAVSSHVEVVLSAMFVCGLSGAILMIVPVYVSEICEKSIRGALSASTFIFYGAGMLLSYLFGGCLDYSTMVYVCLTMTVVSTILIFCLKETPTCLMIKGFEKEAAESLSFYRGFKPDSKEVQEELNTIRRNLNPDFEGETPEEEQLKPNKETKKESGLWTYLRKSRSTRAAFIMVFTLVTASILQGLAIVQVYAVPIFEVAIPTMSANFASTILAIIGIVSGIVAAYLLELVGRRPLIIYASFIVAVSCIFLATQLQFHWGPGWLIAVTIYFSNSMIIFGSGTVPFVLSAEVFLPEIRSVMSMLVTEWAWFCNYITLFMFNPLFKVIGLGNIFYLFAGVSIFTGVYSILFVPETKGLTVDAIQEKLLKKKKTQDFV